MLKVNVGFAFDFEKLRIFKAKKLEMKTLSINLQYH